METASAIMLPIATLPYCVATNGLSFRIGLILSSLFYTPHFIVNYLIVFLFCISNKYVHCQQVWLKN